MNLNDVVTWKNSYGDVEFGYSKGFKGNQVIIDYSLGEGRIYSKHLTVVDIPLEKYLSMSYVQLKDEFPELFI